MKCNLCPRACSAERVQDNGTGICGMGENPKVAKIMLHHWEEPCISGKNGSGTVFFSGCSLKCVFCQNYEISAQGKGKYITTECLSELFERLEKSGAHNINLVNPTHWVHAIAKALEKKPGVPVVYNCGGYEALPALKAMEGNVQIYLADFKYAQSSIAEKYSGAGDYPGVALDAIREMYRQVGDFEIDSSGIMQKGLIIRHLVLPGCMDNSKEVMDAFVREFGDKRVMFSLMGQYVPAGKVPGNPEFSEIDKKVSGSMYRKLCEYMDICGIEYGYTQELASADSKYTPDFECNI